MELKDFWRLIRDSFNSIFENSEAKTNGSYLTIVPWPSRWLSAEFNIVYTDRLYGKDKIMYWSEVLSYVLSFEPLNINDNNFKCNEKKNSSSKRQKGRLYLGPSRLKITNPSKNRFSFLTGNKIFRRTMKFFWWLGIFSFSIFLFSDGFNLLWDGCGECRFHNIWESCPRWFRPLWFYRTK